MFLTPSFGWRPEAFLGKLWMARSTRSTRSFFLGGVAASWNRKRIGYVAVLILSSLSTWGFLGHTTGLTPPNLVEIGRATGVLFVFVVQAGEVASLSALILSIYALGKRLLKLQ